MSEYEDKFELLSSEIERLNSVLRLKTEEIYDLSDRLSHADASVFRQQEENKELIGLSVKLTEELNSIKNELRSGKYEAEEYKFREYQHKLDESAREIDSLNVQLANQRQQLSNQEEEFGSEMDHLREVNVEYESHMVEL
jgi:chromosome segregation ATPase